MGYHVCLVERQGASQAARLECLAPSIAPLLDALGVLSTIERAGLIRTAETRLLWAGGGEESRHGQAWLIDRRRFDLLLRDAAIEAGAAFMQSARARQPLPVATGWVVPVDNAIGRVNVEARFLVDATGRRTARSCSGPPTAALCGRWRGGALAASPEMRVEAGSDAWFWGAPLPDGSFSVLSFLDARRCAGLDHVRREALYRSLLGKSALLKNWMCGGLQGRVAVYDATWRADPEPVTARSIKIGDRSFAMDPLSSQGVQAALRSAVHATAVIHTILSEGDVEAGIEFYCQAQQGAVFQHRRIAAQLYKRQRRYHSTFWHDRSQFTDPSPMLSALPVVLPRRGVFGSRRRRASPICR